MFLPHNIVGVVFNVSGPRLPTLTGYLSVKARDLWPNVQFGRLVNANSDQKLASIDAINMFTIEVHRSAIDVVDQAIPGLGGLLQAQQSFNSSDYLQLTLRTDGRSPRRIMGIKERILGLLGSNDLPMHINKLQVRGDNVETNRIEFIDLLQDSLIYSRSLVLQDPRTRVLDSQSAYEAIDAVFEDNREQLTIAAAVT